MTDELRIDLTGHDSDVNRGYWTHRSQRHVPTWKLYDGNEAKRAVRDSGLTRLCDKVDRIVISVPDRVEGFGGNFLQHFLGPAARKLGPQVLEHKLFLAVRGRELEVEVALDRICQDVRGYLREEEYNIAERAKKKANKPADKDIVWSEPSALFVPDIGTRLKIILPWQTEVIAEYRNAAMLDLILEQQQSRYRYGRERARYDITIQPDSILTVDRVYIRQGKGFENFSSLTFRLAKGGVVVYNGKEFETKKVVRFFANLKYVNKLLVHVDLNTLPGQEKEGTARKD